MNAYRQDSSPGVCVLVHTPDGQPVETHIGLANVELAVPLGPDCVFNVGSVAKQITAYLAVLAVRGGSLDSGAPVAEFLPQVRVSGITVADLIRHDSGIRDAESLLSLAGFRELDHYTGDDLLALAYRQADRALPRGRFLYSNTNYLMLAKILETIHGTDLHELAELLVFSPLGMHTTRFKTHPCEVIPHAVSSYTPTADGGWLHQARPVTLPGPGSLWCSARDLDRWLGHLHHEWAQQGLHTPPFDAEIGYLPSDHPPYRYGAGLYTHPIAPRGTAVFHYGHEHGFSAATRLADNGLRIICLSNNTDISADHLAAHLVQRLTGRDTPNEICAWLGAFTIRDGAAPKRATPGTATEPHAPADQHAWLGTFACDEVPGTVRVSRDGPALYLWRRGTADQLTPTCGKGRIYAGPGYTLTVPEANALTNDHLDAFTLDLARAPGLHYRRARS